MVMTGLFNHWTDQFKVFSCFLAMSEVDFWCIHNWGGKHVENVTNHKCGISISSNFFFPNFSYGIAVSGTPPPPPPHAPLNMQPIKTFKTSHT